MKTNILLTLLMTALAGTTSNVSAADSTTQPLDFLGAPAPAHAPVDKVIVITDNTRYVNDVADNPLYQS